MNIRHVMRMFLRKAKNEGYFKAIKQSFKKVSGITQRERQLDTLYHIINHCIDITNIPPASGDLRKYQLCCLSMLRTFDAISKKYGWTYWLHAGTLLGAVRHKGFIPWDDDVDITMPRKDYDEAIKKLPEICKSYDSDSIHIWGGIVAGGFVYQHTELRLDLFPCDEIYSGSDSGDEAEDRRLIAEKLKKYQNFYYSHTKVNKRIEPDTLKAIINERNNIFCAGGGQKYIVQEPEFIFTLKPEKVRINRYDSIFPLSTVQFEGSTFPAPANPHKFLAEHFGSDYMSFPKVGALHHEGQKVSNGEYTNLDETLEKLKDIEQFFVSQV